MNSERVVTDNELIAIFMDAEESIGESLAKTPLKVYAFPDNSHRVFSEIELCYPQSWDWLMPVVEKIESLDNRAYGFTIDPWGIVITEYASGHEEEIVSFQNDDDYPKIQQYYYCVVEFIKKYQSKNNPPL